VLAARDITHSYQGRLVLELPALDVPARSILGVRGPNGSGKSTLLRILALLEAPDHGRVLLDGRKVAPRDREARRRVSLLTQTPYLLKRSVLGNVEYGLKARGVRNCKDRARAALRMAGLDPDRFARRGWRELSGGEAQRVALAARLAIKPDVLLLDEPTSQLDPDNARLIHEAALKARDEWGAALVAVSHDHAWLESVSDGILELG
jgi:tungstate transport system ATP-binding protein